METAAVIVGIILLVGVLDRSARSRRHRQSDDMENVAYGIGVGIGVGAGLGLHGGDGFSGGGGDGGF